MSYHIATIAGVPIKVHWTFGLLILFVLNVAYNNGYDIQDTLWYISIVLVVFLFVIMHEFGHIMVARRFGVHTRDVIVSPIGGVARLLSMPKRPKGELLIALGGPAVNVILAILIFFVLLLFFGFPFPEDDRLNLITRPGEYLMALLYINIALVLFNMIPAFPMDGGRVFRAILSHFLKSRLKATKWASYLGQFLALGFLGFGGYYGHYTLMFIGLFIFIMARKEYDHARLEHLLDATTVEDIMKTNHIEQLGYLISYNGVLNKITTISQAFSILNEQNWTNASVVNDDHESLGYIDRKLLIQFVDEHQGKGLFSRFFSRR